MKAFQSLIPTLGIFALARAGYYANVSSAVVSYTTITTDIYTTFCPSPTKITQGSKTYTVTEATTLTITDCPCTLIKPVVTVPLSSTSYVNPTPESYTTITTDIYTTFCPSPTMITQGSKTYTVTEATTLTITDCPCTVIKPVVTIPLSSNSYVNPPPEGYTTITTDILTTFCPSPTKITQGSKTYTVTEATTLTITECPCTVVKPIVTIPVSRPDYMNLQSENATVHIWATATVSTYVTVCPTPTTFTAGSQTYTVTESTLLTITNCPCTISYPATPITTTAPTTVSVMSTYCPSPTTIIVAGTTYTASTPGYVSIPVVSTTTYVVPAPVPTTPITLSPLSTPGTYYTSPVVVPSSTKAEIPGPAQVTSNAAGNLRTGIGAIVAGGLAALLL